MTDTLMIFGSLGTTELIILLVIALLIFGSRLPDVMRSMGRGVTEFKRGLKDTTDSLTDTENGSAQANATESNTTPDDGSNG